MCTVVHDISQIVYVHLYIYSTGTVSSIFVSQAIVLDLRMRIGL